MTTQEYYSNFITNHLVPRIGDIPLDKLTGLRLQKLYQELRTDGKVHQNKSSPGLSPKTIRGMHVMLHKALEQAVKEELIKKNPTNDCTPPKVEKKEMKVIKPEQVGTYLQAAANHNVLPMFYLELTSGLRRGELLALLWTDLDPDRHTISISKSVLGRKGELKVSAPKTRHSIRTVMIPQQTVDLLIQEHNLHPDNPYMFPSPMTNTREALNKSTDQKGRKRSGSNNVRCRRKRAEIAAFSQHRSHQAYKRAQSPLTRHWKVFAQLWQAHTNWRRPQKSLCNRHGMTV